MDLMLSEKRIIKGQIEAFRRGDVVLDTFSALANVVLVYDMVGQSEKAGSHIRQYTDLPIRERTRGQ